MGQFGTTKRRWLLSAIRQRKLLLQTNRSRKLRPETEKAVEILDRLLSAHTYENDLYMARFIRQNQDNIIAILPGNGASGCEKKAAEFRDILSEAHRIEETAKSFRHEMV